MGCFDKLGKRVSGRAAVCRTEHWQPNSNAVASWPSKCNTSIALNISAIYCIVAILEWAMGANSWWFFIVFEDIVAGI